ncbi:RHS repeat-associated core domain-containing protein (plasmid) [Leptospira weilii]|nr:RHS repeat-associated core domain-containing protein [Leptospira weilii]
MQIEAKSPVSEKQKRINHVEYNRTLKYKRSFLRKPPYPLIPKPYPLEYVKGRMVRLNSSGDVDGSTKVLQDAVYSFNPNNNITGIANNSTDWSAQYDYGYDGLGRLTNANGSYLGIAEGNLSREFQQSYSYAKNGNLTAKRIHDPANGNVTDDWSYQYTNHQVTNIDSSKSGNDAFVMQYDANGNLTRQRDNSKDLTKRISVDSQDRITQIQDGNNAVLGSYWYDEGGFRIRKSSLEPKNNVFSNVEILYPNKFFGLEFIESENVISSVNNVYLNGVRIAALNEVGALAYFLTDQVDSVSLVLDDEGKTLSKMQYLPYGETFVQRGDTNFAPKYNSQELDRESGFYFYNARFYDPGIARFTSADTIIDGEFDTQGWNRFSYVKGNPIGAKDPTGHLGESQVVDTTVKIPLSKFLEEATKKTSEKAAENSGKVFSKVAGKATGALGFLVPSEVDAPTKKPSTDNRKDPKLPIYHRLESPTQTSKTAKMQEQSGEIWGKEASGSNIKSVQAYTGPLPKGKRGVEFITAAKETPGSAPGQAKWLEGSPGVRPANNPDYVKINVRVTKNTQTEK